MDVIDEGPYLWVSYIANFINIILPIIILLIIYLNPGKENETEAENQQRKYRNLSYSSVPIILTLTWLISRKIMGHKKITSSVNTLIFSNFLTLVVIISIAYYVIK